MHRIGQAGQWDRWRVMKEGCRCSRAKLRMLVPGCLSRLASIRRNLDNLVLAWRAASARRLLAGRGQETLWLHDHYCTACDANVLLFVSSFGVVHAAVGSGGLSDSPKLQVRCMRVQSWPVNVHSFTSPTPVAPSSATRPSFTSTRNADSPRPTPARATPVPFFPSFQQLMRESSDHGLLSFTFTGM